MENSKYIVVFKKGVPIKIVRHVYKLECKCKNWNVTFDNVVPLDDHGRRQIIKVFPNSTVTIGGTKMVIYENFNKTIIFD